jgi:molybdopterin-guanine dinucleotide biosynthesis protein A
MKFSAVILAGGRSQRMGRDKAMLNIDGKSLLTRQMDLVHQRGPEELFISGRPGVNYAVPGCVVLHDGFADAGPLGGIERALGRVRSPLLLVLAVDMPEMTAEILGDLASQCTDSRGAVPRVGGRCEPLAAFYPKAAWRIASSMLAADCKAATQFAERCVQSGLADFYEWDTSSAHHFTSWNRPADVRENFIRSGNGL